MSFFVAFAVLFHLSAAAPDVQAAAAAAPEIRLDTPSGFPVPRFVSLKEEATNCRMGPSFEHPVRFVFQRAGAPVLVVAESIDHWRKIRDSTGDECWVHQSTLKAQTHVLVVQDAEILRRPERSAASGGRVGAGVLARLLKRREGWLYISAQGARGWIISQAVWGVQAGPPPDLGD